jgi:DNA-directed RNA polymerase specialized sigma24 family protein
MAEIARMLDISLPTVERDWRFARAWLQERMGANDLPDG